MRLEPFKGIAPDEDEGFGQGYDWDTDDDAAFSTMHAYDDDQARDDHGRWTSSGGGDGSDGGDIDPKDDYTVETAAKEHGLVGPSRTEATEQVRVAIQDKAQTALGDVAPGDEFLYDKDSAGKMFPGPGDIKEMLTRDITERMGTSQYEALANLTDDGAHFKSTDLYLRPADNAEGKTWHYQGDTSEPDDAFGSPWFNDTDAGLKNAGWDVAHGDNPEVQQQAAEAGARILVGTWATTSNDHDTTSLALQMAAVDEFGLKNTIGYFKSNATEDARVLEEYKSNENMYRGFLRAQYENTQQFFKDSGVDRVLLYRGFKFSTPNAGVDLPYPTPPDWAVKGTEQNVSMRPLSAFSTSSNTAEDFASTTLSKSSVVIAGWVPVDQILSTSVTGIGCHNESEMVVLGGLHKWTVLDK